MKIIAKGFSVAGPVREVNEDTLLLHDENQIFLVADGMGGHVGGAQASKLGADTTVQILEQSFEDSDSPQRNEDIEKWEKYVKDAISGASQAIFKLAADDPALRGMGTTVTSIIQRDGIGIVGHVGDSRLYLYRSGVLYQLTNDHTIVNEMLEAGDLSPSQVEGHPFANVLTKAVGVLETVSADTFVFELVVGDKLLLCSDGFYGSFANADEMYAFVVDHINEDIIEQAEKRVTTHNAQDNVTLALLEVVPEEATVEADTQRSQEVILKVEVLQDVNLFRGLEVKEIVSVVQASTVRRIPAGEIVVSEGESSTGLLYVILDGEMQVGKGGGPLALLSKGNHFGEISILLEAPRSATVKAVTDATLLEIPKSAIDHLLSSSPRAGVQFLLAMSREFADRLAETNRRLLAQG